MEDKHSVCPLASVVRIGLYSILVFRNTGLLEQTKSEREYKTGIFGFHNVHIY